MPELSLDDKYTAVAGDIVMSGIQALVRVPLDQHLADRASGLNTATLVSGYRGSPLGGLDVAFEKAQKLVEQYNVKFLHGVNEDLAATAIYGSQLSHTYAGLRYDGVLGMWYGKGPGVDRTGDAFRHANVAGVAPNGGVLAVAGDDPSAKSSTVASASEFALLDAGMPILYPGTVQEVLELGRVGFALSRYCGSWVGLKIVTNVADAFSTVQLQAPRTFELPPVEVNGQPWRHVQNPNLLAPHSLNQEREMHEGRSVAIQHFLRANKINSVTADPSNAWLGIVASGKTYHDVLQALRALGIGLDDAAALGIRVLKLNAMHPIEPQLARHFARGLTEILVVEEKRGFIELFLRDALYGMTNAPRIVGKYDENNAQLLPGHGELDADKIKPVLRARMTQRISADRLVPEVVVKPPRKYIELTAAEVRTPYFCSGCPHNRSTHVPEGSVANGAVGCSTMAMWMDRKTDNILQMGAEGVHWVGAALFSDTPHIFQNIGDGTFLHSGSLAIRQAVAAGTTMTYKLLYNAAVAMTGGQQHDADLGLGDIVAAIKAEGVAKIIVVSDDPDFRKNEIPAGIDVWHRDRVMEAQTVLRDIPGVTVMVYDQACAADLRRKRKRGQAKTPSYRIMINEAVCEGCGDCGVKSNCLSVQPVDAILGRKTQIHQASCNFDETCTTGHCPAFVKVTPGKAKMKKASALSDADLPAPVVRVGNAVDLVMTGVGGTGVVTVNQILGVAARIEGKFSTGLDQTGLAQKGGSVVSHFRVSNEPIVGSNLVGAGGADVLLAFDPITAAQDVNLARLHADRTYSVVNSSILPTGPQVRDVRADKPSSDRLHGRIAALSREDGFAEVNADALCEDLFGNTGPSNVLLLGAAYQLGLIPISAASIEEAITLNGASVANNITAFRAGRAAIAIPTGASPATKVTVAKLPKNLQTRIDELPEAVRELVSFCANNLIGYQDAKLADSYLTDVIRVAKHETLGRTELTATAARALHHLIAYKDEYEVARLHRSTQFTDAMEEQFGEGASPQFLLQPPVGQKVGLKKKIALGKTATPMFVALAAGKKLRGTKADAFGQTAHRKMERALAGEYRTHIDEALRALSTDPKKYEAAVALLASADQIRGFDHVKEANVDRWRKESSELLTALRKEHHEQTV